MNRHSAVSRHHKSGVRIGFQRKAVKVMSIQSIESLPTEAGVVSHTHIINVEIGMIKPTDRAGRKSIMDVVESGPRVAAIKVEKSAGRNRPAILIKILIAKIEIEARFDILILLFTGV